MWLVARLRIDNSTVKGAVPSSMTWPSGLLVSCGRRTSLRQYARRLTFRKRAAGRIRTCCSKSRRSERGMMAFLFLANGYAASPICFTS